ncbi:DUF2515 family protein [Heyndrickxia acidiproducens]|uniref:DUF2515 family protein n=1 Tax=Heyndrickxia acidiproducens TaxID=1121084 RepID=UPI0003670980|nr:DUF2515 family protein [Heyndrickxia acidiproducens]
MCDSGRTHPKRQQEHDLAARIQALTTEKNRDNLTRTDAYFRFYLRHPEIKWAFLASMVSRNAGWNMCDLEGADLPGIIPAKDRRQLFLTYERANWAIFEDAFPQLLAYHYVQGNRLFRLLTILKTSRFMITEWRHFFQTHDEGRLLSALIINEQNIIQNPVIEQPYYKKQVFSSKWFWLQDLFHLNSVVFPTPDGKLYGDAVVHFKNVPARIALGKRLAGILFHPDLYGRFLEFASTQPHTGSRYDYEHFLPTGAGKNTPCLREVYPALSHHWQRKEDWSERKKVKKAWYAPASLPHDMDITNWYLAKRKRIRQISGFVRKLKRLGRRGAY